MAASGTTMESSVALSRAPSSIPSDSARKWGASTVNDLRLSDNHSGVQLTSHVPGTDTGSRGARDTAPSQRSRGRSSELRPRQHDLQNDGVFSDDGSGGEGEDVPKPWSLVKACEGSVEDDWDEGVEEVPRFGSPNGTPSGRTYSVKEMIGAFNLGYKEGQGSVLGELDHFRGTWAEAMTRNSESGSQMSIGPAVVSATHVRPPQASTMSKQFADALGSQGVQVLASTVLGGVLTLGKWGALAGLRAIRGL